ncbi:MAG: DoxX family protein [Deltaproteobacteria bacterium]|nr:DoxX family protein [Deltaproteobacteria bacterium]
MANAMGFAPISKKELWGGRIISALVVLFLLFDSITKLMRVDAVMKATVKVGYPPDTIPVIGLILLVCTIIYVIPATSILGAVLLTGYLGGAVATNLRIGNPLFSNTLFPVYFGILVWGGLFLRDRRLRSLLPIRKGE